jgi:hypothetical protein
MDAATLSALAAFGAAAAAITGATFQFFIGRKQANAAEISANAALANSKNTGRQKVADFRQQWIHRVIDTICDHHAIVSAIPVGETPNAEDKRRLAGLRTKLSILLNPDEPDTVALLDEIENVDNSKTGQEFAQAETQMVAISRRLLKREWVRIKGELS